MPETPTYVDTIRHMRQHEAAADRNPTLTYLQTKNEVEKVELTRQLHDNLGGLMVAATMDAAWIGIHWTETQQAQRRLQRVRDSLNAAIDLKRKLIEALRPTLLDNFGLLAALRWHFTNWCSSAKLVGNITLPENEPELAPDMAIALFRFVQESLDLILAQAQATAISLTAEATPAAITLCLAHDGLLDDSRLRGDVRFASLKHRIEHLLGSLRIETLSPGVSLMVAWIPLPP